MCTERTNCLLKEYEMCQDYIKSLESTIWITSGVIGIGSIGSLISIIEKEGLVETFILGAFVIILVWIWWSIANRWWDIQHVTFMRMRHIENELGLFQKRYIKYLDKKKEERDNKIIEDLNNDYQDELIEAEGFEKFHKGKVRGNVIYLPFTITIIWIVYFLFKAFIKNGGRELQMPGISYMQTTWVHWWVILIVLLSVFIGGLGVGVLSTLWVKRKKLN